VKLELPTVTLACADCIDNKRAEVILERCKSYANFGAVKLLTHFETDYPHRVPIKKLESLSDYSGFMLRELTHYVQTSHVLVVQHDGHVLNPEAWDPHWLYFDYVAPLWIHQHAVNNESVGSGGFSLRSKGLLELVAGMANPGYFYSPAAGWAHEDGVIAMGLRRALISCGMKFAPAHEAAKFAQGGQRDTAYYVERPFGFHGQWPNINRETGVVAPWPEYGSKIPGF
jgi:hypothetical protein